MIDKIQYVLVYQIHFFWHHTVTNLAFQYPHEKCGIGVPPRTEPVAGLSANTPKYFD